MFFNGVRLDRCQRLKQLFNRLEEDEALHQAEEPRALDPMRMARKYHFRLQAESNFLKKPLVNFSP